jgi:zinc protease
VRKFIISVIMLLSCQTFGQVQEFILHNGLKILVKEDHRSPIAVSMMWYNVGSADEPGGITGVSHAIEHMMFKGTPAYPLGVYSKTIASLGGQDNAFTNNDYTAYFATLAATKLETSFKLEADRMNNLLLEPSEFSKEIKVIQEERRLRTDDNPQALAFERFLATAHLTAPYHHPVIGWMSDLKQMAVQDVKAWYQRYYAPNNATLVVVGDVKPQEVFDLAKKYFGAIPSKPIEPRHPQKEPPALGKKIIKINAPGKLPMLLIGYSVPSLPSAKNEWEPYALELIAALLDAGEGARFATHLIRGSHAATGAEVYYNMYARYQTQFIIYGTPSNPHSFKELNDAFMSEIDALKHSLVSDHELRKIKHQIIAQKTFEKDSPFSQAMQLGLLSTVGIGWQKSIEYESAINSITAEQIRQTAKQYFQENNMTEAELQPIPAQGVTP